MTEHEFEYWQAVMERSAHHWTEDDVTRLNGKGDYSSDDRKEDCLSRGLGRDAKECLPLGL